MYSKYTGSLCRSMNVCETDGQSRMLTQTPGLKSGPMQDTPVWRDKLGGAFVTNSVVVVVAWVVVVVVNGAGVL